MAQKEFNTRIKLKYDTLANWLTNQSVILLEGEIGLCFVPAITSGTTTTAPTVLFKVGDGKQLGRNSLGVLVSRRMYMNGQKGKNLIMPI